MPNILYIGDPTSIHDLKWMSAFSNKDGYNAYMLCQDLELNKMKPLDHERLEKNNITLAQGHLKFYSLWRQWDNWHSADILKRTIEKHRIDLIHIFFITPFALNALYTEVPTILTSRGSDSLIMLPSLLKSSGIRKLHDGILFNLFGKAIRKSKAITCTSKPQAAILKNLFGNDLNTHLIRTGVDVKAISETDTSLSPGRKTEGKKMVFFPRYIQPIYNTMFQVEALKLMPTERLKNLQLVFVEGRNPDQSLLGEVKSEIEKLGVEHHFVSYLDQAELWALYRSADLTVMTPKSDGTPNSGLEAMSAKSQLIVGNLPYDEDLFNEQSCIKMKSDEVQELTDLIMDCLQNPDPSRLDSAFTIVSERGNRKVEMGRLEEVYRQVLG